MPKTKTHRNSRSKALKGGKTAKKSSSSSASKSKGVSISDSDCSKYKLFCVHCRKKKITITGCSLKRLKNGANMASGKCSNCGKIATGFVKKDT